MIVSFGTWNIRVANANFKNRLISAGQKKRSVSGHVSFHLNIIICV